MRGLKLDPCRANFRPHTHTHTLGDVLDGREHESTKNKDVSENDKWDEL